MNSIDLIESINFNLQRLGVDAYNHSRSGLQAIIPNMPKLDDGDIAIELFDDTYSDIYRGQLLSDILYIAKFASQATPSKYWIWEIVKPASIETI